MPADLFLCLQAESDVDCPVVSFAMEKLILVTVTDIVTELGLLQAQNIIEILRKIAGIYREVSDWLQEICFRSLEKAISLFVHFSLFYRDSALMVGPVLELLSQN